MPRLRRVRLVVKRSSPTSCTREPSSWVRSRHPSQSSSAKPSSMEMTGKRLTQSHNKRTIPVLSNERPSPARWYCPPAKNCVDAARQDVTLLFEQFPRGAMDRHHRIESFGKAREPVRHGQEILELEIAAGMQTAGEDIDHRHRDDSLALSRQALPERDALRRGGRAS